HNHKHFCPFCMLLHGQLDNVDWWTWVPRNSDDWRNAAQQWLEAPTPEERNALFGATGIRYSELSRLPYWDPVKHTAIDPMHNLFLGNFRNHIEEVWGIN
ncbi:hypothetical protein K474DRAFT_1562726, partial [Panus rudis PR-1116 ss-1]